jgi:hypothetical protein
VGKPIPEDDEVLELPAPLDPDDEAPGLAEAEELALADIPEGPEDIGLETEVGTLDSFEPGVDLDEEPSMLDDVSAAPDDTLSELDIDDEEGGWLDESEGAQGSWDEDLVDDEEGEGFVDDGGLEGVEDPMLDGLDDEEESVATDADGDSASEDLGEDLLREIGQEGAVSGRG